MCETTFAKLFSKLITLVDGVILVIKLLIVDHTLMDDIFDRHVNRLWKMECYYYLEVKKV